MAEKRIKGITIEIGGETKGLDQAIQKVNQTISKTNTELKDLNKALKLDPKNTELLAQKQDVLREKIQATQERLKTLVEAQKQMGDYSKLTDEQKEKYRALSVEITHNEDQLKKMNSELKTTSKIDLSKLKEGLKKVGDIAVEVSKKLLQISTAIGGALASVIGLGIKSYASLEQNIGGINKLFGESADELIAKSKEAYRTAGLSANQYMETATSFSASLLKGLGGDTEKAVALTDRAIQDMSDNANTFGSSMEEVMNVYKALSKEQFSTLDNLRLGYAGTKEGMKQLISDASKYTDIQKELNITVKDGDMSFANMINAISVMQKHLNITGTTMKEAEGTITGSVNQMKASFDNFLNGSGSPEELSQSILNVLKNLAKAIKELAPNILKGIVDLIKTLIPEIGKLLFETIPELLDTISNMVDELLDLLTNNTEAVQQAVTDLINKVILFITDNLPKILQIAIQLVVTLANGIAQSLPTIIPAVVQCIITIVQTLLENIDLIIDAAVNLIMAMADAITDPNTLDLLIDAIPQVIESLIMALMRNAPKFAEMGLNLMIKLSEGILHIIKKLPELGSNIISAIIDGIKTALPDLLAHGEKIFNTIKDVITKLPENAIKWGKDFIGGFVDGIKKTINKVKEAAGDVGNAIKNILHFSRPDEGPLREYETWMPDFVKGLAKSMTNSKGILENATLEMANDMTNSILGNTSNALRGLKAGVNASLNPTINPSTSYDLNYQLLANAIIEGLEHTPVILNDREVGKFVDERISEEVYS